MWVSLLWRRAGLPTLAKVLPHGLGVSLEVPSESPRKRMISGAFRVRPRGLEPPRTIQSTRPSTLRVYQFRHRRLGGQYIRGVWHGGDARGPAARGDGGRGSG